MTRVRPWPCPQLVVSPGAKALELVAHDRARRRILLPVADGSKMVFLGFGKFVRADKIYALEPILGDERGGGHRTRVWVEGIADPIVASRTERSILREMGSTSAPTRASSTTPSSSPSAWSSRRNRAASTSAT